MRNDESRKNDEILMTNIRRNDEVPTAARLFVIWALTLIRHSSFVLRHFNPLAG
jgi:hypothetical protein